MRNEIKVLWKKIASRETGSEQSLWKEREASGRHLPFSPFSPFFLSSQLSLINWNEQICILQFCNPFFLFIFLFRFLHRAQKQKWDKNTMQICSFHFILSIMNNRNSKLLLLETKTSTAQASKSERVHNYNRRGNLKTWCWCWVCCFSSTNCSHPHTNPNNQCAFLADA